MPNLGGGTSVHAEHLIATTGIKAFLFAIPVSLQVLEEGDQLPFMFRMFRIMFYCLGAGPVLREAAEFLKVLHSTKDLDWTFVRATYIKDGPSLVKQDVATEVYAGPMSGVRSSIQAVDLAAWMVAHTATEGRFKQSAPCISN